MHGMTDCPVSCQPWWFLNLRIRLSKHLNHQVSTSSTARTQLISSLGESMNDTSLNPDNDSEPIDDDTSSSLDVETSESMLNSATYIAGVESSELMDLNTDTESSKPQLDPTQLKTEKILSLAGFWVRRVRRRHSAQKAKSNGSSRTGLQPLESVPGNEVYLSTPTKILHQTRAARCRCPWCHASHLFEIRENSESSGYQRAQPISTNQQIKKRVFPRDDLSSADEIISLKAVIYSRLPR